ncbi:hypothetical protein I350_05690 [Cryptococcus amylolentus CBS 6273]|uniref:nitric oxide dioxygenase n=1 Tax=Cryptococcus amylolentus CBS 6273 TaxID=1296118 RepID=A0A1E3JPM2_9TREE|nr:hypothetical protein I350_05690 [Cryptococcus amylolentus CBS 6273]
MSKTTTEAAPRCPFSGQAAAGATGCPLSAQRSAALPVPSHRCDPASLQDELKVPEVPPLTDNQKALITATVPILAEHGLAITSHFYKNMILAHPELRDVFSISSQELGHQPQALAAAVYAYAANINDLTPLLPTVERIAHKHTSLHITPEQYGIVGKHLIQSIVDILGDAVTPEIGDAWYNGYWNLAHVFIDREKAIYSEAVQAGGWEGWRSFKVVKRVKESDQITSFYLKPADGSTKPLPKFNPGQYTAVSIHVPALGHKQARQYSLSDAPNGDYYRISVKCEDGVRVPTPSNPTVPAHPGWMSNLLHKDLQVGSLIDVASPYGDFFHLPDPAKPTSPLVLLSAGVGQTPLMSILNSEIAASCKRPITYVTVAKNQEAHAWKDYLKQVSVEHENVLSKVFYSAPGWGSWAWGDYDFKGRMNLDLVKDDLYLNDNTTRYFLCGPAQFMISQSKVLQGMGVDEKRIHFEMFEAGELPVPAA